MSDALPFLTLRCGMLLDLACESCIRDITLNGEMPYTCTAQ